MPYPFQNFLRKMFNNFRRIARMTKNEQSVEDLQSESWIIANEIGDHDSGPTVKQLAWVF